MSHHGVQGDERLGKVARLGRSSCSCERLWGRDGGARGLAEQQQGRWQLQRGHGAWGGVLRQPLGQGALCGSSCSLGRGGRANSWRGNGTCLRGAEQLLLAAVG